jgi:hypothetical protein
MPEIMNATSFNDLVPWTMDRTPDIVTSDSDIVYPTMPYVFAEEIFSTSRPDIIFNVNSLPSRMQQVTERRIKLRNLVVVCESIDLQEEDMECCICMEIQDKTDICKLSCNHTFCTSCIGNVIKGNNLFCALCREPYTKITTQTNENSLKILTIF